MSVYEKNYLGLFSDVKNLLCVDPVSRTKARKELRNKFDPAVKKPHVRNCTFLR